MQSKIAVLGGAGYIGSHTCYALAQAGHQPVVIDNLSGGHADNVRWGPLEQADIRDTDKLIEIFQRHKPAAVIHFAAKIEVSESIEKPDLYHDNNVGGTQSVLKAMEAAGIPHIVFSSTAAVYGQPKRAEPLTEASPTKPINPYGETKLKAEQTIQATPGITSICLRYFNASGAAPVDIGLGEMHRPETHLIPIICQAALGLRDGFAIFGDDYPTPDGTAIRDYIHVLDLADAHIKALDYLLGGGENLTCNLGTKTGHSVQEIVTATKTIHGQPLNPAKTPRREGDPAFLVADNGLAQDKLGWAPKYGLKQIIQSAYDWHGSDRYKKFWLSE